MTHPNGSSAYADLGPTQAELDTLDQVIQEVLAGELGALPGDDEDGPWHDQAALAGYASDRIDLAYASEQQRQAEDGLPLPRLAEDRIEILLSRASRGTYTPPPVFREPGPSHGCGTVDEFGRCSARYHQGHCMETLRGSAATGDHTAARAWSQALLSNPSAAGVTLARADLQSWDDLLDPGTGPTDTETLAVMRRQLGITGKADLPPRADPAPAGPHPGDLLT
jgi:hypothetical protein